MQKIILDLNQPNNEIVLEEDTEIFGLFVGKNSDNIKIKLKITHPNPHVFSRILVKAVVYDEARFDMEATVCIDKGAVGTDTYLKIDTLIMDETAFARAVPSLEIKVDEVKGGHGATVGHLDPEQIYYLRSRGFDKEQAKDIVVEAFIEEVRSKL